MGGCVITMGDRHIVRQITVDQATLDRVAEALGIPLNERQQFISGTDSILIYRGRRPGTPPASGAPPAQSGGGRP
jgi:hypothetical protein